MLFSESKGLVEAFGLKLDKQWQFDCRVSSPLAPPATLCTIPDSQQPRLVSVSSPLLFENAYSTYNTLVWFLVSGSVRVAYTSSVLCLLPFLVPCPSCSSHPHCPISWSEPPGSHLALVHGPPAKLLRMVENIQARRQDILSLQ